MSAPDADDRLSHPFDEELENSTLFAWFGPMFELLGRHWQIALGTGVGVYAAEQVVESLPWPWVQPWWIAILHGFVSGLATTSIAVAGYLLLAQREAREYRFAESNSWQDALLRAAQVCATWTALGVLVASALRLLGKMFAAMLPNLGEVGAGVYLVIILYSLIIIPIVLFLLSPVWMSLGVAGALSTAHAVRSSESGWSAVLGSLDVAFSQKWRVFWGSYVLGVLAIGTFLFMRFVLDVTGPAWDLYVEILRVLMVSAGVAMTFVVERVYAPYLGALDDDGEATDPAPTSPADGTPGTGAAAAATASGTMARAQPRPVAPASATIDLETATAADIADRLEQDLRANRIQQLIPLVERGLAIDAQFLAERPDATLPLAKRIAQERRPDLAVRVLQPFIKRHKGHRLHLTAALFAAGLLLKDARRLPATARFLEQLKSLYPTEPMVDQLIKQTEKALALAGK